ncbi:MAG: hypothetical protein ACRDJ2_13785 [Actinomycetota bacterium]
MSDFLGDRKCVTSEAAISQAIARRLDLPKRQHEALVAAILDALPSQEAEGMVPVAEIVEALRYELGFEDAARWIEQHPGFGGTDG